MGDRRPAERIGLPRRSAEGAEAGDSALDREIDAALAVDPSPEFVARIRARIASEPAPASWWQLRWVMLVPVASAAVVVVAAAIWLQEPSPEQVTSRAGNDVVLAPPALEQPAIPQLEATAPPRPWSGRRTPPAVARTLSGPPAVARTLSGPPVVARTLSGPREPEVLISRDEQRGLELLLTAVRDGRITPTLASQLVAPNTATEAADIAISDIVIQPLQQFAALEGEGQ